MQQGIAIIVLILILALMSSFMWVVLSHDKLRFVRVAFLYFNGIYFVISAVKGMLGSWDNALCESFWDMEMQTYVHYGMPLLLLCIVTLALLLKVKWFTDKRIIDTFCTVMFMSVIVLFLVCGKITNLTYCILFVICICLTLTAKIADIKEQEYYKRQEFGGALRKMVPCVGAWVVMHCIFLPNELYLCNLEDFSKGEYMPFLAIMCCSGFLIMACFLLGALLLLPKKMVCYMNLFMMAVTLMGYIQNMFLNGKMEILDGDKQIWSAGAQAVNSILWISVLIGLVGIGNKKKAVRKAGRVVCIYIILIQMVTLGYLILTTDRSGYKQSGELTIRNSLEISQGQNVLVFVLDRFDSSWMETLYEEDAAFCDPLSDFTFYRNATSQFANTGSGIPYLLTATAWKESHGTGYSTYAYQESSLLQDMKQQGFDLGIYTGTGYVADWLYDSISNYDASVEKTYDIGATVYTMWRCSMYQTTPFLLKQMYSYYSDDIADMVKAPKVWDTENDYPFFARLQESGLAISDSYTGAFRFYHMHGAHEPYTFSENMKYDKTGRESGLYSQIRGSMKIVYAYMEQMKQLGKYDDATIIITADHGQQTDFIEETAKPQRVSSPVILIKEPQQTGMQMQVSNVPVSQAEMMASMVRSMGMDSHKYGSTLDEAVDDPHRERIFLKLYPEFVRYTIVGDVWDIDNWEGELLQE